jgi:hypothetical protein
LASCLVRSLCQCGLLYVIHMTAVRVDLQCLCRCARVRSLVLALLVLLLHQPERQRRLGSSSRSSQPRPRLPQRPQWRCRAGQPNRSCLAWSPKRVRIIRICVRAKSWFVVAEPPPKPKPARKSLAPGEVPRHSTRIMTCKYCQCCWQCCCREQKAVLLHVVSANDGRFVLIDIYTFIECHMQYTWSARLPI